MKSLLQRLNDYHLTHPHNTRLNGSVHSVNCSCMVPVPALFLGEVYAAYRKGAVMKALDEALPKSWKADDLVGRLNAWADQKSAVDQYVTRITAVPGRNGSSGVTMYRKTALTEAKQFETLNIWRATTAQPWHQAVCDRDDIAAIVRVLHIHTLEGWHEVTEGDWIARGVKGEFWPIKPDIFAASYAPVADGEALGVDAVLHRERRDAE